MFFRNIGDFFTKSFEMTVKLENLPVSGIKMVWFGL